MEFEDVENVIYLGTLITKINLRIDEGICMMGRLNKILRLEKFQQKIS